MFFGNSLTDSRRRFNLKEGEFWVPSILNGITASAFFFLTKVSSAFKRKDLKLVVVSESLACKLAVPFISKRSSRRPYVPVRWTATPGTPNETFSNVSTAFLTMKCRGSSTRSILRGHHPSLDGPGRQRSGWIGSA